MDCDKTLELMPLHIGGDLAPDEAAEVERHVAACARCAADLAAFRAPFEALKGQVEVAIPAGMADDLWTGVKRGLEAEGRIRRPRFGSPLVRWAAVAAVFMVGLFGALWAMRSTQPKGPSPKDVANQPQPAKDQHAAQVQVPSRPTGPRGFDLRSVATPVSDRGSSLDVVPAGKDSGSYKMDELRVIPKDEVSLGY